MTQEDVGNWSSVMVFPCSCRVEQLNHNEPELQHSADCGVGRRITELEAEIAALKATLDKINGIRNSIVGFQIINWSEHIYPLVAALNEAGFTGEEYSEARPKAETLLERANAAEADTRTFRELVEEARITVALAKGELKWEVNRQQLADWLARAEAALRKK